MRVLGIDPGSAATGWALLEGSGMRAKVIAHGVLRERAKDRATRLGALCRALEGILDEHRPDEIAIESPFSGLNPRSGLVLAETRGALLAAVGRHGMCSATYSPAEVKKAVVGNGRAEKSQVAYMVVRLLALEQAPPEDAADAMAVALTHLRHLGSPLSQLTRPRRAGS